MIPLNACNSAELIELEILVFKNLSYNYYKDEAELFRKKWFDYRFMHPVQATEMFMLFYKEAYSMISKLRFDHEQGKYRCGVRGTTDKLFDKTKTVSGGFWKARQVADKHCIPYDFYCNHAMRYADSHCWTYMPKPNQLYGEKMQEFILLKWHEELGCRLLIPTSSFYSAQNKDHIYYNDYIDYLTDVIKRRRYPKNIITYLSEEAGLITSETADIILSKISSH